MKNENVPELFLFLPDEVLDANAEYDDEKRVLKDKIVRNEFETSGKYGMPLIRKQNIDLSKIELWNYTKAKAEDEENKHKIIHFFTYDWNFESVYEKPEKSLEKLESYYGVLSPEFSLYWDMPLARQIDSVFKNRWCGAFWQKQGLIVIPTVCCCGEESYDFCFDGIEEGCVVAVSNYRRETHKKEFLQSYKKMMQVIKPTAVICYGEPFEEMEGNVIAVNPFNQEELIAKMGLKAYLEKKMNGTLYPSN